VSRLNSLGLKMYGSTLVQADSQNTSADAKIILFDIILYITKSITFIITLNNAMRIDPFTGTLKTADR